MSLKPIRTQRDLERALTLVNRYYGFPKGSREYDLFEIAVILVEDYQKLSLIHDYPDPIEALRYFMRERGYTLAHLAYVLGSFEEAKDLLKRRKKLTMEAIWKLVNAWGMAPSLLIKPYELTQSDQHSHAGEGGDQC